MHITNDLQQLSIKWLNRYFKYIQYNNNIMKIGQIYSSDIST